MLEGWKNNALLVLLLRRLQVFSGTMWTICMSPLGRLLKLVFLCTCSFILLMSRFWRRCGFLWICRRQQVIWVRWVRGVILPCYRDTLTATSLTTLHIALHWWLLGTFSVEHARANCSNLSESLRFLIIQVFQCLFSNKILWRNSVLSEHCAVICS